MKTKLLALLLLTSVTLIALATPSAAAVGSCTGATNAIKDPDCPYLLCWGTYTDQWGRMRCQYTIYWPCQYCVPIDE